MTVGRAIGVAGVRGVYCFGTAAARPAINVSNSASCTASQSISGGPTAFISRLIGPWHDDQNSIAISSAVPLPSGNVWRDRLVGAVAHGDGGKDWAVMALEQARASGLA